VLFHFAETVCLIVAYGKNEQADIDAKELRQIKSLISQIESQLRVQQ
jgi:hypothetical protein